MAINTTVKKEIKYLGRDFTQFKSNLINFTKTYFQNTFNDFSPNDPGMMFIEMASFVGDTLSFYLDTQIKETMLLYAEENKNVLQLAQSLGYRPRITSPSITNIEVFQLVPSIGSGESVRPDYKYALRINPGMIVSSTEDSNITFRTTEELDFGFTNSFNPTDVSIYQMNNNEPTYYLLKKTIQVESGIKQTQTFGITDPEKYKELTLSATNIISIDSVIDSDGNDWTEVDYLAQDSIFKQVKNVEQYDPELSQYKSETPYLLKLTTVPKRFVRRYNDDYSVVLQFGSGVVSEADEEITPNPDNVGLTVPTGVSKLNYDWDVSNFMYSSAYGEAPSNTTLTVTYTVGGGLSSNVVPNVLKNIVDVSYISSAENLDPTMLRDIKASLATNNPNAATGGRDTQSIEEIRHNALAYFASQGRTVSMTDYVLRAYSMPQQFGSIAKAYIVQDEQLSLQTYQENSANPLTMNLYLLTYDANKRLTNANLAIKNNIKSYLDRYRMLTDSINIRDAYIVNIQVIYEITVLPNYSANEVLLYCTNALKDFFAIDRWEINQPIIKADIFRLLANLKGVQSVMKIDVYNLFDEDEGYSPNVYDIQSATKNNVIYNSKTPMIWEVKYLDKDILGKVISY